MQEPEMAWGSLMFIYVQNKRQRFSMKIDN